MDWGGFANKNRKVSYLLSTLWSSAVLFGRVDDTAYFVTLVTARHATRLKWGHRGLEQSPSCGPHLVFSWNASDKFQCPLKREVFLGCDREVCLSWRRRLEVSLGSDCCQGCLWAWRPFWFLNSECNSASELHVLPRKTSHSFSPNLFFSSHHYLLCMCVCLYVCMCVYLYVCVHVCACMLVCVHVCMPVRVHVAGVSSLSWSWSYKLPMRVLGVKLGSSPEQ